MSHLVSQCPSTSPPSLDPPRDHSQYDEREEKRMGQTKTMSGKTNIVDDTSISNDEYEDLIRIITRAD